MQRSRISAVVDERRGHDLRDVFEAPLLARQHVVASESTDDLACDEWLTEAMRLAARMAHAYRFQKTADSHRTRMQLEAHLRQRVISQPA